MSQSPNDPVRLKVHLAGAIAYVPDNGALWALMPNALVPAPARWRQSQVTGIFRARAPHIGLLMVAKDLIVGEQTTSPFKTVFEPYSNGTQAFSSPTAVMPLIGSRLDFVLSNGSLTIGKDVDDYFPQLAEISRSHSRAARKFKPPEDLNKFDPNDQSFAWRSLSAAFPIRAGALTVEGYFGKPDTPDIVEFGYVASNRTQVPYYGGVWKKKIANKLLWEVALPAGQRSITINCQDWGLNKSSACVLQPPKGQNEIEVTIAHAEAEVPLFFLGDPFIPGEVSGRPDPDFEMFYELSSNDSKRSRWRVPLPEEPPPAGATEKPCTGGMFVGFEP